MNCATENCERLPERNGYCATCNRERRKKAAPKEKPKRQRISKTADPERIAIYISIKAIWIHLPENMYCKVCKTNRTNEPHHKQGKEGDLLFDVRKWLPVCRRCHERITLESEWAYNEGLSLSRHQTKTI